MKTLQFIKNIFIKDSSGAVINPATSDNQEALIQIAQILQSILTTQERIASQSPRLTRNKEMNVAMDNFGQAYTTSVVNANSNPSNGVTYMRTNEIHYFSNMGANHLYRNII